MSRSFLVSAWNSLVSTLGEAESFEEWRVVELYPTNASFGNDDLILFKIFAFKERGDFAAKAGAREAAENLITLNICTTGYIEDDICFNVWTVRAATEDAVLLDTLLESEVRAQAVWRWGIETLESDPRSIYSLTQKIVRTPFFFRSPLKPSNQEFSKKTNRTKIELPKRSSFLKLWVHSNPNSIAIKT